MVSEWHNADFEEVWAKKKTNAYRRKSRSAGFIVDDEDGDAALKKAIKKKKNKSSMWFTDLIRERTTDSSAAGVLYEIQVRTLFVYLASSVYRALTYSGTASSSMRLTKFATNQQVGSTFIEASWFLDCC